MNITYFCEKCKATHVTYMPTGTPILNCKMCGKIMSRISFTKKIETKGTK